MMNRNSIYAFILYSFTLAFVGCTNEDASPNSITGSPSEVSVEFTSNSSAVVTFQKRVSEQSKFKLKVTDEFGVATEFGDITASPAEISDLPKGRILTIQMAGGTNAKMGDFGDASEPMLASTLSDKHNMVRIDMLNAINEARAEARLCGGDMMDAAPPLNWDDRLETAAEVHTVDMHDNQFFAHTSATDGSDPGLRINSVKYIWRTYGENIYRGGTTVDAAMAAWLKSEPHCKNIMNANVKEVGVSNKGTYWTQVFASE